MPDDLRSQVMTPGHCSFCGRSAEQHAYSRRWWHTDESCNLSPLTVVRAGEVPAGPLGFAAQWPPRFKPGPYKGPAPFDPPAKEER